MPLYDPKDYPNRVIIIDETTHPPTVKMNCVSCGKPVEFLYRNNELCEGCYKEWSLKVGREWLRMRFGNPTERKPNELEDWFQNRSF